MESTTASLGETCKLRHSNAASKAKILVSIEKLSHWLEENDYRGYDTFDGLNAKFVRPFTFETKLLRTVLQQGVRRFPLNLRPLFGITREHSSKGMGFLARGFIRLHESTGDPKWATNAEAALQWLIEHQAPGYSGACWEIISIISLAPITFRKAFPRSCGLHWLGTLFWMPTGIFIRTSTCRSQLVHASIFFAISRSFPMETRHVSHIFQARLNEFTMRIHLGRACWPEHILIRATIATWS